MEGSTSSHHPPARRSSSAVHLGGHAGRGRSAQPAHRGSRRQLDAARMSGRRNSTTCHPLEKTCKFYFYHYQCCLKKLSLLWLVTIDICLLARLTCLHSKFTSPTVHHQKWCFLPTHKPQTDWAEKNISARTNPPPSFLFFCCEWVTSATFHYTWTNSDAQTNQLSTNQMSMLVTEQIAQWFHTWL